MKRFGWATLVALGAVSALLVFSGGAAAQGSEHGLGGSTTCASPTKVGDPVFCSYSIRNNSDDFGDTMRAHTVVATAQSPGGSVPSGNIFSSLAWVFTGTVTCVGGSGSGTLLSPRVGATSCDLADGARITSLNFSFYTAQPIDATVAFIPMLADYAATDLCDGPGSINCPVQDLTVGVSSQTTVLKRVSATATQIHNEQHQTVLTVAVGTTVHDFVSVTSADGGPVPTGNVNIDWFLNGDCTGPPAANSGSVGPLDAAGNFDATGFAFLVSTPGMRAFRAHYEGSPTYNGSDGACEPLKVVDAWIEINPPTDTNATGTNHVLTITVHAVNGTLGDGTATASIVSGPGSFVGPNSCNYTGGGASASCQVTITSAVTGTSKVHASSDIPVDGIPIHRETETAANTTACTAAGANPCNDALKKWVDAWIEINPPTDTNATNTNHVLTITVHAVNGTLADGIATASIVSGPGSFVGPNTCNYTGGGATASCQVTITSAVTGTSKVHAASTISVDGQPILRETETAANTTVCTAAGGNPCDDALKKWVDAWIEINPPTDTNAVNTNHVLTITVHAVNGTLADGTATASIVSGPGSFVGPNTCNYTGGGASASCQVTITSAVTGTTKVHAASDISVDGQTIHRETETAANTALCTAAGANPCDDALKKWVDAWIEINPPTDTNATNTNHVLTITVHAVNGTLGNGTANASIVSGPGSFVGPASCDYTGGAATASCQVTITSAVTGTSKVHASSDIPVDGQTIHRETETAANTALCTAAGANPCDDALKKWVDAWIEINPATDTNPVNTDHVLTITVHAVNGLLDAGPHTATASIVSGPGSFVGPSTCSYIGGGTSASCTVTITSAVGGTTQVHAAADIPVDGQVIHRETQTAANTVLCTAAGANPCDDALKKWVDAWIEINPPTDANAVNTNHVLTITVHAVNGTLGNGTATATIVSGPGSFVGPNTCSYTGGGASASCQVTITSAVTGTSKVHAASDIPVDAQSIHRETETAANTAVCTAAGANPCDDALKKWVDAWIEINPPTDTNAVNTDHVLTITVHAVNGTLADGTATASIVSGPGSFVGSPSCNYTGGGASASCQVTITSAVTGTSKVHAASDISVDGQTIHRETETAANTAVCTAAGANPCDDALKKWVDAWIEINPPTDTNAVNTDHVLTITVHAVNGTLGNGTATASIVSGPGSFVGSPSCNYTGGGASASCQVTITSAVTGTSKVHASSDIPVDGQNVHRETETAANTALCTAAGANPCDDALKKWVDAWIEINPPTDNNPVGTNHVLTITVHAVNGTLGNGTATANIVSGPGSFVGSPTCSYTGGGASASCQVTITSNNTGTTVVHAASDISVDGQTIHRETETAANTALCTAAGANPCDDAEKNWADDTVRTDIHDAAHATITSANVGDVVHDKVFVEKAAGTPAAVPNPTGNVTFNRFDSIDCTGAAASSEVVSLAADGTAESSTFTVAGPMSYQASYAGDANYPGHTGACEPLAVQTKTPCPAGTFGGTIAAATGDLVIKYDQFPAPNDNSYGVNAVGWGTKGHTFGNLVGSDHAGFTLVNPAGTAVLDFEIDYISTKTGTPSGYASLGPFGGDGGINTGTLTPADITFDSSLARNLNNTGYFAGGTQVVGTGVANLLVDSPPTLNTTDSYTLTPAAAAVFTAPNPDSADSPGWNFHDTYFVTLKAAKLASLGFNPANFGSAFVDNNGNTVLCAQAAPGKWCIQPNEDRLHNSPAKPCPCPAGVDPNATIDVVDNGNGTRTITFTQSLAVNDNSYGTGTDPSWGTKTHTFSNLLGSDKAEFRLTNGNGQVVNDFFIDYISAKSGTTSGFGSLCTSGGDGSLVSGPAPVSCTTSLDQNLNNIPCPSFTTNSPSSPGPDPACPAWEFKSIYKVTVNNSIFGASGFGGVTVPAVHNSPSKPSTCPAGAPGSQCSFTITKKEVKDRQVKITIKNNGSVDEVITAVNLTWPAAINGTLKKIKLGGDVIYDKPDIAGGTANLTTAQLTADQKKRRIGKGKSEVLTFEFEKNADANLANYTGSLSFGPNCVLTVLP